MTNFSENNYANIEDHTQIESFNATQEKKMQRDITSSTYDSQKQLQEQEHKLNFSDLPYYEDH